jgi:hypothetical protein
MFNRTEIAFELMRRGANPMAKNGQKGMMLSG